MPDVQTLQKIEQAHYFELSTRVENLSKKIKDNQNQKKSNIYASIRELVLVNERMIKEIEKLKDVVITERKRNIELQQKFEGVKPLE